MDFKFPGQGQRETPVADARGIVSIIFVCRNVLLQTVGIVLECVRFRCIHQLRPTFRNWAPARFKNCVPKVETLP